MSSRRRRSKFGAIPTEVDGIRFASKKEARCYCTLKAFQKAGKITDLRLQVAFPLRVNGSLVCTYVADFVYIDRDTGEEVVADAKGFRTREYALKKKLLKALYDIEILEL